MVTIHPLQSAADARQYQEKSDNYYAREQGQKYGEWKGEMSKHLGLAGQDMNFDKLENVLSGKDPHTGDQIIKKGPGEERPGLDCTVSPDKSFSVFAATSEEARQWVTAVEQKVVEDFIKEQERLVQARVTKDGVTTRVNTHNVCVAVFGHNSARDVAGKPSIDIHHHLVTANMTQTENGPRAIANESLMCRAHMIAYTENARAYHAQNTPFIDPTTGKEVSGLSVSYFKPDDAAGDSLYCRLNGVTHAERTVNSPRANEIRERIDSLREEFREKYPNKEFTDGELAKFACLDTREAKHEVSWAELIKQTDTNLNGVGSSLETVRGNVVQAAELSMTEKQTAQEGKTRTAQDYVKEAVGILEEQPGVFSRENMHDNAAMLSRGAVSPAQIETAFHELQQSGELVKLPHAENLYTTANMIEAEAQVIRNFEAGRGAVTPLGTREQTEAYLDREYPQLNPEQRVSIIGAVVTTDQFYSWQGVSGSGKSTSIEALAGFIKSQGAEVHVMGTSHMATAAGNLQLKGGIESQTLDSLLYRDGIKPGGFCVVDESSTLSTMQARDLTQQVRDGGGRALLIGDVGQGASPNSGRPVAYAQENGILAKSEINISMRQQTPEAREIGDAVRSYDVAAAFRAYEKHGAIVEFGGTKEEIYQQIAADYVKYSREGDVTVFTPRNADREGINLAVREALKAEGQLKDRRQVTVHVPNNLRGVQRNYAGNYNIGDKAFFTTDVDGYKSGETVSVAGINIEKNSLTLENKKGEQQEYNLTINGKNISSYTEKQIELAPGDKGTFLKNDTGKRGTGVTSRLEFTVNGWDEHGHMQVETGRGPKTIPANYTYYDHGYAQTVAGGQGLDKHTALGYLPTGHGDLDSKLSRDLANVGSTWRVIGTRHTHNVTLYTDNKKDLQPMVEREQYKQMAHDYLNNKLPEAGRPSMETLRKEIQEVQRTTETMPVITADKVKAGLKARQSDLNPKNVDRSLMILEQKGELKEFKDGIFLKTTVDEQRMIAVENAVRHLREDGKRHITENQISTEMKKADISMTSKQMKAGLRELEKENRLQQKMTDDGQKIYRINDLDQSKTIDPQNYQLVKDITAEYGSRAFTARDISESAKELGSSITEQQTRGILDKGVQYNSYSRVDTEAEGKTVSFYRDEVATALERGQPTPEIGKEAKVEPVKEQEAKPEFEKVREPETTKEAGTNTEKGHEMESSGDEKTGREQGQEHGPDKEIGIGEERGFELSM